MTDGTVNLRTLIAERDRLIRERIARLSVEPSTSREQLYACALEIAVALTLPDPRAFRDPIEQARRQIEAMRGDSPLVDYAETLLEERHRVHGRLDQKLGADGAYLPEVGPLGRPWTTETLLAFVSGLLFARGSPAGTGQRGQNWQPGPNALRPRMPRRGSRR
jgi:hypothetical protein